MYPTSSLSDVHACLQCNAIKRRKWSASASACCDSSLNVKKSSCFFNCLHESETLYVIKNKATSQSCRAKTSEYPPLSCKKALKWLSTKLLSSWKLWEIAQNEMLEEKMIASVTNVPCWKVAAIEIPPGELHCTNLCIVNTTFISIPPLSQWVIFISSLYTIVQWWSACSVFSSLAKIIVWINPQLEGKLGKRGWKHQ